MATTRKGLFSWRVLVNDGIREQGGVDGVVIVWQQLEGQEVDTWWIGGDTLGEG